MDRPTYWGWVVALFIIFFLIGFIGETVGMGEEAVLFTQTFGLIPFWILGYQRCQDAGVHGAWAIFTPILIGMIWIGCLKSKRTLG
jgi:uncharacterized membrane protein YhaH (DUF805 family)